MKKIAVLFLSSLLITNSFFAQENKELSDTQVERMAGFCKIWGLMKYYHPEVKSLNLNWDSIACKYIPEILNSRSYNTYNTSISGLINEVSPLADGGDNLKDKKFEETFNNLDFDWIENTKLFTKKNSSEINHIIKNYHAYKPKYPNEVYGKPYWQVNKKNELSFACSKPIKNYLIAFNYWNFVNYFSSHKNFTDTAWSEILIGLIQECNQYPNEIHRIISKTHALLNDGNAACNYLFTEKTPFKFKTINDTTLISGIADDKFEGIVNIGDQVSGINGINIQAQRELLALHTSAPTKVTLSHLIDKRLPIYSKDSNVIKIINQTGKVKTIDYTKVEVETDKKKKKKKKKEKYWKILEPYNYGFIDLDNVSFEDIYKIMKKFRKTQGLILDFRDFPRASPKLLKYLTPSRKPTYETYSPVFGIPGTFTKHVFSQEAYKDTKFKYSKPIVILINENTKDFAESMALVYKSYENTSFVGRSSAATNGQIMSLILPENIKLHFSVTGTTFPAGEQFERIGITPAVYVSETVNDFRQAKDKILEAAIKFLNEQKP